MFVLLLRADQTSHLDPRRGDRVWNVLSGDQPGVMGGGPPPIPVRPGWSARAQGAVTQPSSDEQRDVPGLQGAVGRTPERQLLSCPRGRMVLANKSQMA